MWNSGCAVMFGSSKALLVLWSPPSNQVHCKISALLILLAQRNGGQESAFLISSLSSQNPGGLLVANTLFGSSPSIPNDILAKAF
uniref:Cupin type-1 domain-containing protein n=1 Tax=Salix viminalis TaxID=40686 RepID=A0A6N2LHR4_SALVM